MASIFNTITTIFVAFTLCTLSFDIIAKPKQGLNTFNYEKLEACRIFKNDDSHISQLCSSTAYSPDGKLKILPPVNTKSGDLLLLFLSRTDAPLALEHQGWKLSSSCFKKHNDSRTCHHKKDRQDLATVVLYREYRNEEFFAFDLEEKNPSWAILVSVRGASLLSPIGGVKTRSRDDDNDSLFPSLKGTDGDKGDLVLLSMAYDDTAKLTDFAAPSKFSTSAWVTGEDEAGFLYTQLLRQSTRSSDYKIENYETQGDGGKYNQSGNYCDKCKNKDLMISIIVKSK